MPPRDSKVSPKNNKDNDESLLGQIPSDGGSSDSGSSSEDDRNENVNEGEPGLEDGVRLERLRRLRREHRILLRERAREERLLAQEIALRDQMAREIEIMELRNQELRRQRIADLAKLRSLETSDEDQEEAENPDSKDENTATDETGIEINGTAEDGENGVGKQK